MRSIADLQTHSWAELCSEPAHRSPTKTFCLSPRCVAKASNRYRVRSVTGFCAPTRETDAGNCASCGYAVIKTDVYRFIPRKITGDVKERKKESA